MALSFYSKPTATLKAKLSNSTSLISIPGVTTANTTPANAAAQVNKLFGIAGKAIVADTNMTRTQTEEVVDNG